jgi:glycosyltransferase involved in cell wall biosynthesis
LFTEPTPVTIPTVNSKKKIMILVEWFTPGYKAGGPIQSCLNIAVALKDHYDIYVFTTDTDHGEITPYDGILTNEWFVNEQLGITLYYMRRKTISFKQVLKEITIIAPDFIYLNLLFSPHFLIYPLWLKYRNKINASVILCPRGTLYDSALSLKWYQKKPMLFLYRKMNIQRLIKFHATNEREKRAIEHFFPGSNILVANNLPNVNQPGFTSLQKDRGQINCIFISRIVPIKNLLFILKFLEKITAQVNLTVVGPEENALYWNECKNKISTLPDNITVTYLGARNNKELMGLMQQHHLLILPTTGENFGHVIFESFLAGRPVLISDQTPWLNLPHLNVGWDLPLDEPAAFVNALEKAANWDQHEFNVFAKAAWQYAQDFINDPLLTKPYHQLFS